MTDRRAKATGRRGNTFDGPFLALPRAYFNTPEFYGLSGRAAKLLIAMGLQYSGSNNGDLCATFSEMKRRGFTSADQLRKARNELIASGWIVLTRQGGRSSPSLFALTWRPIDECSGKLDIRPGPPVHLWKPENADQRAVVPTVGKSMRAVRRKHGNVTATSADRHTVKPRPPHGQHLDRDTVKEARA